MIELNYQSKIRRKISNIKMQTFDSYTPTKGVIDIVQLLFLDDYDAEKVHQQVEQEAQAYYERRKKFVEENAINENMKRLQMPTQEGSRRQICSQICHLIQNSHNEVVDINATYHRLHNIIQNSSVAMNAIIEYLIINSRLDDARNFLNENFKAKDDMYENKLKRQYQMRIRNAEIVDFIMRGIKASSGGIADENKYYETILRGIEQAAIPLDVLVLGKSKDGLKMITLKDIMEKPKVVER